MVCTYISGFFDYVHYSRGISNDVHLYQVRARAFSTLERYTLSCASRCLGVPTQLPVLLQAGAPRGFRPPTLPSDGPLQSTPPPLELCYSDPQFHDAQL